MTVVPMQKLDWHNPWLQLPATFYQSVEPTPLAAPYIVHGNEAVARLLGLDPASLCDNTALRCFNGVELRPGMQSIATVYAGHQFGIYTSKLGDGRAVTLGETEATNGGRYEIQLKGAGLTPYSRTLDGRLPLVSALREYLAGEALAGLGIPGSRGLCLLAGSTRVRRDDQERTAAILVRVTHSHIRFGHFEYFHHLDDFDALRQFFVFVIERQFPELFNESASQWPLRFLEIVVRRTARLVADWQSIGFVHGVMNTDNMTLSGESLDLGPFGFVERYDPEFSPNPSDDQQRYRFDQQPDIGRWNCLALAQALTSLLPRPTIPAGLLRLYRQSYQQHYLQRMRAKLGLYREHAGDPELLNGLCSMLTRTGIDYADFFRRLGAFEGRSPGSGFADAPTLLRNWLDRYRERLALEKVSPVERRERMSRVNPCCVLRAHFLDRVADRAERGDFDELARLVSALQNPYEVQAGSEAYCRSPEPQSADARVA